MVSHPTVLRILTPRSGEDFIDRLLMMHITGLDLINIGPNLQTPCLLLVSYGSGKHPLLLFLPISRITLLQS